GLGPAYHGPLPEAMRAERERSDTPTTEPVPGDVRSTMRDVLGIDVGDRLVHRGPAVSAEAKAMGAQAFTRDGEVHIADEVGPLDTSSGRATLAHELTHAAQQIAHGTLPDESSMAGKMMEAHAQRVEQYVRGDASATKPSPELLHARPQASGDSGETDVSSSTQKMMRELIDTGLARSDGQGGIVFTMPPSTMTGTRGTQRLEANAPHAASQEHWDPLATFGHSLSQGLSNDMLGIAGSFLGFSDEYMGEQRHELVGEDRQFRRDQVTRAYTDLRMEHLRAVELRQHNEHETAAGGQHSTSLSTDHLQAIEHRVTLEVNQRLALLDEQTAQALDRLNQRRTASHQAALLDVPDENFIAALTALFDDPDTDTPPSADALLATLTQTQHGSGLLGGAPRPGGGPPTTPRPPGGGTPTTPTGAITTPTASALTTTTPPRTGSGPATTPGGTPATTPATGPGTGTGHTIGQEHPDEPWRTAPTMGGRFEGIASGLAHNELATFGSFLGFDSAFEQGLHDQISPHHDAAAATATTPPTTPPTTPAPGTTPHPDAAHHDAAHPDAAHVTGAHAAGAHQTTPAHESVDHIVSDPYALDELANRLYPNIRTRLRQELLIDRERAGLLADFR
ncbi:MAG: eCIS core domain-containing protein, partial [Ilumatobacteraceae bacterium]